VGGLWDKMGISGCWWKEVKGLYKVKKNKANKGEAEGDKVEDVQVYTHSGDKLNDNYNYPFGTAIALARNMPTLPTTPTKKKVENTN